jgi:hypothetical protein
METRNECINIRELKQGWGITHPAGPNSNSQFGDLQLVQVLEPKLSFSSSSDLKDYTEGVRGNEEGLSE